MLPSKFEFSRSGSSRQAMLSDCGDFIIRSWGTDRPVENQYRKHAVPCRAAVLLGFPWKSALGPEQLLIPTPLAPREADKLTDSKAGHIRHMYTMRLQDLE